MRVLFISNYANLYGANKSMLKLMLILKRQHNVTPILLVSGEIGAIGMACRQNGITVYNHNFRNRTVHDDIRYKCLRKLTRYIMRLFDAISVYRFLHKKNVSFDIVHSNSSIIDIGYYLAKWNHVPHVWHIREFLKDDYHEEIVYSKRTICEKYRRTDRVIAISNSIQDFVNSYGTGINCLRIYNGIELCDEYDKKYCQDGVVNICAVGVISPGKNQMEIIRALTKLKIQSRKKIHLHIVGDGNEEYCENLKQFIAENDLRDIVIFHGYCNKVDELLKTMDIGIVSSEREAFGRVTIEFMSNYMAVIASDTGANSEIIEKEWIYPLHNVDKLAELIEKLICDYDLLGTIGKINREKSKRFDARTNAKEINEVYLELMK